MPNLRIPLFPLNVVLLPGKSLPLHIFEPRYKLMIQHYLDRHSTDNDAAFGIVLAREGGIASVGCTAAIVRVIKRYEDGRMDIMIMGRTAYRIGEVHTEKPYFEATIELLADDLQPGPAAVTDSLWDVFAKCYLLLHNQAAPINTEESSSSLAFALASEIPIASDVLQELLEIRVEAVRRSTLLERLNQMLPQLIQLQQVRSKAGGNGHALN